VTLTALSEMTNRRTNSTTRVCMHVKVINELSAQAGYTTEGAWKIKNKTTFT
jgi:hypothetical protein